MSCCYICRSCCLNWYGWRLVVIVAVFVVFNIIDVGVVVVTVVAVVIVVEVAVVVHHGLCCCCC